MGLENKVNVVVGVYYALPRQNHRTDELFYSQDNYLDPQPLYLWEISTSQTSAGNTILR